VTVSVQASVLSNCESNRIEKSIRQRESNRIESNYFSPNRNALLIGSRVYTIDQCRFQFFSDLLYTRAQYKIHEEDDALCLFHVERESHCQPNAPCNRTCNLLHNSKQNTSGHWWRHLVTMCIKI